MIALPYPVFGFEPDLTSDPKAALEQPVDILQLRGALGVGMFPAAQSTSRIFSFDFAIKGNPAAFLEFWRGRQGQPFFLPSWRGDMVPKQGVTVGQTTLQIEFLDYQNRNLAVSPEDWYGRYLFLWAPGKALYADRVIRATASGGITDTLDLDSPIPWAADQTDFIVGNMHLVRFAESQLQLASDSPDHHKTSITFRSSRLSAKVTSTPSLRSLGPGSLGYLFNGSDNMTIPTLALTGEFTIAFWTQLYGETDCMWVGGGLNTGGPDYKGFVRFFSGGIHVYMDGEVSRITHTWTPPLGWVHIAVTRASGVYKIYINGVLGTTNSPGGAETLTLRTVGNSYVPTTASYGVNGRMADLRIFNVAKTAPQIALIHSGGDDTTGLLRRYRMNDGRTGTDDMGSTATSFTTGVTRQGLVSTVDQAQRGLIHTTARVGYALGPASLGVPQGGAYSQRWACWPNTATKQVRIKQLASGFVYEPDATGSLSALTFPLGTETNHLSLAFTSTASEVVAYQVDEVTIALRGPVNATWTGFAPSLFYVGLALGHHGVGAHVLCYYLRKGKAKLYVRSQADSYATELVAADLPFMPIDIRWAAYDAGTKRQTIELIDGTWRSCILTLQQYP